MNGPEFMFQLCGVFNANQNPGTAGAFTALALVLVAFMLWTPDLARGGAAVWKRAHWGFYGVQ